ncbi:MAG: methyltransferase family protein [Candidatus Eiseniibacteriota bacterium]
MTLINLDLALFFAWPVAEYVLGRLRRARRESHDVQDRGSQALLWAAIAISVTAGMFAQRIGTGGFGLTLMARGRLALALLVAGLSLRVWAIVALGKFFTVQVALHSDHRVVRAGPYRWLRHPSYSGALIAFAGLGVLAGNAWSLGITLLGTGAAFAYRIAVEERALRARLGEEYVEYSRVTKRLVPFVY